MKWLEKRIAKNFINNEYEIMKIIQLDNPNDYEEIAF